MGLMQHAEAAESDPETRNHAKTPVTIAASYLSFPGCFLFDIPRLPALVRSRSRLSHSMQRMLRSCSHGALSRAA